VPAKVRDVGAPEKLRPGGSKARSDFKDAMPPCVCWRQRLSNPIASSFRGTCRVWRFFEVPPSTVRNRRLKSMDSHRNITHHGGGHTAGVHAPYFPPLDTLDGNCREGFGKPGPKVTLKLVERVGGGAGAVSFHPRCVHLINELPERLAFAVEAMQRVPAVGGC
jgi:hypothetical protein